MGKRWREDGEGGVGKRSVNPEDVVTRNGKRLAACPSHAQDWRRAPVTRKTGDGKSVLSRSRKVQEAKERDKAKQQNQREEAEQKAAKEPG